MTRQTRVSRRTVLTGAAAVVAAGLVPPRSWAQPAPIKLGTLTPLTGAGGSYGPSMRKAMEFVAGRLLETAEVDEGGQNVDVGGELGDIAAFFEASTGPGDEERDTVAAFVW